MAYLQIIETLGPFGKFICIKAGTLEINRYLKIVLTFLLNENVAWIVLVIVIELYFIVFG